MKLDAIVLLGYSGVGKDTTFAALDSLCPHVFTNVKFGRLAKELTAKAFDIDVSELEDKELRKQGRHNWCGLSPLDLLTVLYRGITPELTKAHISYALMSVNQDYIPVFTDIRRHEEAEAVKQTYSNVSWVYLWGSGIEPGVNDSDVEAVACVYQAAIVYREGFTSAQVAYKILEIAND